jgi:hypothetical protein
MKQNAHTYLTEYGCEVTSNPFKNMNLSSIRNDTNSAVAVDSVHFVLKRKVNLSFRQAMKPIEL